MKQCTKCGEEKELIFFPKDDRYKSGFSSWCKSCRSKSGNEWKKLNRKKANETEYIWRYKNWDKYLEAQRKTYHKNIEKRRKYLREFQRKFRGKNGFSYESIRRNGELSKELKSRECEFCGTTKDLCIHHKDNQGRANLIKGLKPNNDVNNLMIICRSCHTKLHHKIYAF